MNVLRWPLLTWALTSAVLAAWAFGVDYGLVVVAVYVGLNVIGFSIAMTKRPPYTERTQRVIAWCAAAQLPVMIVPWFDRDLVDPGGHKRENRDRMFRPRHQRIDRDR